MEIEDEFIQKVNDCYSKLPSLGDRSSVSLSRREEVLSIPLGGLNGWETNEKGIDLIRWVFALMRIQDQNIGVPVCDKGFSEVAQYRIRHCIDMTIPNVLDMYLEVCKHYCNNYGPNHTIWIRVKEILDQLALFGTTKLDLVEQKKLLLKNMHKKVYGTSRARLDIHELQKDMKKAVFILKVKDNLSIKRPSK